MPTHTLAMQNGSSLVLRLFEPASAPRAAVIIPSAMTLWPLAPQWLSMHG